MARIDLNSYEMPAANLDLAPAPQAGADLAPWGVSPAQVKTLRSIRAEILSRAKTGGTETHVMKTLTAILSGTEPTFRPGLDARQTRALGLAGIPVETIPSRSPRSLGPWAQALRQQPDRAPAIAAALTVFLQ